MNYLYGIYTLTGTHAFAHDAIIHAMHKIIVLVANVGKKVHLRLLQKQASCQGMSDRITPALVKEISRPIKIVEICLSDNKQGVWHACEKEGLYHFRCQDFFCVLCLFPTESFVVPDIVHLAIIVARRFQSWTKSGIDCSLIHHQTFEAV